jgi:hypothetical protein
MSPDRAIRSRRGRSGKESSRTGGVRKKTTSNVSAPASQPPLENPSDIDALRKARLEYLEKPPEEGRKKMRYVGEIVAKASVTRKDVVTVKKATNVRRRHKATTGDSKHSHRNVRVTVRTIKEPDEREFVYHQAPETEANEDLESKTEISEAAADEGDVAAPSKTPRKVSFDNKKEREERRRPQRRQSEPLWRRNFDGKDECTPVRRYEIVQISILPALTIPEHLLLETPLDHHCRRASRAVTPSPNLRYSAQSRLPNRGLKSSRLVPTQHQNMQEKALTSSPASPASFLLHL